MKEFRRYYWDSGVFCSFLSEEEGRFAVVQDLLREAHSGRIEIVTSSFALVEVLKLKGHAKIADDAQQKLRMFFEFPFIKIVNADRDICESARNYVWTYKMASKDAVHMATAEVASRVVEIHGLFSWDSDFLGLNGKTHLKFPITVPFLEQGILQLQNLEAGDADPGEEVSAEPDDAPSK